MGRTRTAALTGLALTAFASNSLLCRAALAPDLVDPAGFTAVRLGAGALVLGLLAAATGRGAERRDPRPGSRAAALALATYAVAFSFAYRTLTAGCGALILFGAVQITMIGAGWIGGHRPTPRQWLGLATALAGLVVLTLPGLTAPDPRGAALMALAGSAWGAYSLLGRSGGPPVAATAANFARTLPAVALLGAAALATGHARPLGLFYAAASGALASGVGYAIWYAALPGLTPAAAAVVQLAVPVLTASAGSVLLDEPLSARLVASSALVLGGIATVVLGRAARQPRPGADVTSAVPAPGSRPAPADAGRSPSPPVVLVLVNRLFEWSQNFVSRELVELAEQGVPLHVGARSVSLRDDLDPRQRRLLDRVLELPENPFTPACLLRHLGTALAGPRRYLAALGALLGMRHDRPTAWLRGVVCLFRAAAVAGRVESLGVRLIHAHFLTAPGETAVYLARLVAVPCGATAHAMDIYVDHSGLAAKLRAATYVATCTAVNQRHLRALPGVDPGKIHLVYHGIDVPADPPAPQPHRPFVFLAAGRLVEKKGFAVLLEACARLRAQGCSFRLRLVGDGPLAASLAARAADLALGELVDLAGRMAPAEMGDVYRASDVLVVPSLVDPGGDRDGLPNVCLEAMSHGLPIVASDVSGIPEGVIDGINGWLVPPGDPAALAEALNRAMQPGPRPAMQAAARRMSVERFALAGNVARLRELMTAHAAR